MTARPSIKKKGQIQLNETILVVFVVVIIIFVGLFLVYKYSIANIKQTAGTLSEQEVSVLLASLPALPEIRCASASCLDTAKFIPFISLAKSKAFYYAQLLGTKKITITQIYPELPLEQECTLAHYQHITYPNNCNSWVLYNHKPQQVTGSVVVSTVVSLYFPELDQYRIGRMLIEVYL